MVQFGRTLNEVVKTDWRCHAVAYIEMKRALSQSGPRVGEIGGSDWDDVHSVHTESSYCVSDSQKANFFRIYNDSVFRLNAFYEDRVAWAQETSLELEKAVKRRLASHFPTAAEGHSPIMRELTASDRMVSDLNISPCNQDNEASAGNSQEDLSSASFLILRVLNFSQDLDLVLEFLQLNSTAFSKIMKKFDKRTGSNLREKKLKELKSAYPYFTDGGDLKHLKQLASEWLESLRRSLRKNDEQSRSSYSSVIKNVPVGKKDAETTSSDNPQCCDSSCSAVGANTLGSGVVNASSPKNESILENGSLNKIQYRSGRRHSIHETKDSRMLRKIIDKVYEELHLQKLDSPFFEKQDSFHAPPSFLHSEVETGIDLGRGEFCSIFEVCKFDVPESCHICFLHRGFNDPDHSLLDTSHMFASPSSDDASKKREGAEATTTNNDEGEEKDINPQLHIIPSAGMKLSSGFSFELDANISDYDELESDHSDGFDRETRGFMKDHCLRNKQARYAVKRIRSNLAEDCILDATIDLSREAQFLAALCHPNIIKIRGTSSTPGNPKYSLILDRLYDTLEVRISKWKKEVKRYKGNFMGLIGKNKSMLHKLLTERLLLAYDIAHGMSYLHSHGIIHRDIKPANIGFDIRGDIKIFDFGLAKELKPSQCVADDKYQVSGLTGTRRYMAPEVALVVPYGLSVDVYSFGILIWEMLTLKVAFEKYSREMHYREVIVKGKRLKICKSWPFVMKDLVKRSWSSQPSERPSFQAICEFMKFAIPGMNERSELLISRSQRSMNGPFARVDSKHAMGPSPQSERKRAKHHLHDHILS